MNVVILISHFLCFDHIKSELERLDEIEKQLKETISDGHEMEKENRRQGGVEMTIKEDLCEDEEMN